MEVLHVFRFDVGIVADALAGKAATTRVPAPDTGFAECTGLEATMEPKVIREGGNNYGVIQRAGPVTFGTVVLKRGVSRNVDLFTWFAEATSQGKLTSRRTVSITLKDRAGAAVMSWHLRRAMPVKFKAADLNAKSAEIGIEEVHLVHEGLDLEFRGGAA